MGISLYIFGLYEFAFYYKNWNLIELGRDSPTLPNNQARFTNFLYHYDPIFPGFGRVDW